MNNNDINIQVFRVLIILVNFFVTKISEFSSLWNKLPIRELMSYTRSLGWIEVILKKAK